MIEVEVRGLLTEQEYSRIDSYLNEHADTREEDGKTAYYYSIKGGILKVVDEHSISRAKLSLKLGNEFNGLGMEEYEVHLLNYEQYPCCQRILVQLGYSLKASIEQKRVNFRYRGVCIALKHTPSWGFHFEVEVLVESQGDVLQAREAIDCVCKELKVTPLSEEDLRSFIARLESK